MARKKTTFRKGTVVHCTPEGKLSNSPENRARLALQRLEKLLSRGFNISSMQVKKLETTGDDVICIICHEYVQISRSRAESCNFTIICNI